MAEQLMRFNDTAVERLSKQDKEYYRWEGHGFSVRVYPTGKKAFYYFYRFAGKKKKILIGAFCSKLKKLKNPELVGVDTESARKRYRELEAIVQNGGDPAFITTHSAQPEITTEVYTVNDLLNAYIKHFAKKSKSPDNVRNIKTTLTKYLKIYFDLPANELSRKKHLNDLLEEVADTRPGQARNILKGGRAMYSWAVKKELVENNPFAGISTEVVPETAEGDRVLSDLEIIKFWTLSGSLPTKIKDALRMILVTGQRPGEICSMAEKDLDLDNNIWTMPKEKTKYKNREHVVWLSKLAHQQIPYIWDRETGRTFRVSRSTLSEYLKVAITTHNAKTIAENINNKTDLPLMEFYTPRDLRRTFSTGISRFGCSDEINDEILQHKKSGVIKIYNKYKYLAEKEIWSNRWSKHLANLLNIEIEEESYSEFICDEEGNPVALKKVDEDGNSYTQPI